MCPSLFKRFSNVSKSFQNSFEIEPAEPEPPPAHIEEIWIPRGVLGKDFGNLFPLTFPCFLVVLGRPGYGKSTKIAEKALKAKNDEKCRENNRK